MISFAEKSAAHSKQVTRFGAVHDSPVAATCMRALTRRSACRHQSVAHYGVNWQLIKKIRVLLLLTVMSYRRARMSGSILTLCTTTRSISRSRSSSSRSVGWPPTPPRALGRKRSIVQRPYPRTGHLRRSQLGRVAARESHWHILKLPSSWRRLCGTSTLRRLLEALVMLARERSGGRARRDGVGRRNFSYTTSSPRGTAVRT